MLPENNSFKITVKKENNIQGGDHEVFVFNLWLNGKIIFGTEDLEPMISLKELPDGKTIALEADSNSAELGEFCEMMLTKSGNKIHFQSKPMTGSGFSDVGETSLDLVWHALGETLAELDRIELKDI